MDICNILVVEDDPDINKLLCRILEGAGYACRPAFSGSEAALWAGQYEYDLVLLDPQMRKKKTMPIIVLSAKAGLEDRVNVLKLGADDFIPKPFDNAEVLARVEAQLRRYKQFSGASGGGRMLTHGDLTLDRDSVTVTAGGRDVTLTAREFEILALLMEHPKKVFTREQLYEQVWGGAYMRQRPHLQPARQAGQGQPHRVHQDRLGHRLQDERFVGARNARPALEAPASGGTAFFPKESGGKERVGEGFRFPSPTPPP